MYIDRSLSLSNASVNKITRRMFFPRGFLGGTVGACAEAVLYIYLKPGLLSLSRTALKETSIAKKDLAIFRDFSGHISLKIQKLLCATTPNRVSSLFAIKGHCHYCLHYHEYPNEQLDTNKDSSEKL